MAPMFIYALFCQILIFIAYASPITPTTNTIRKPVIGTYDPATHVYRRANFRVNATNVPQSISNWIDDVNAVSSFLNVALGLPLGSTTKSAALNALSFAQDEPTNLKLLRATPGLDANGVAAASTLDAVFGDVLNQLQIIAGQPYSVSIRFDAVSRLNFNRCGNVLPAVETLWRSAAVASNTLTATFPPTASREAACPGFN